MRAGTALVLTAALVVPALPAAAADTTIAPSHAGTLVLPVELSQLTPPACAGMNLTSLVIATPSTGGGGGGGGGGNGGGGNGRGNGGGSAGGGGTTTVTTARGTTGNDLVLGTADADLLDGRQGDDCLVGGAGIDVVDGGQDTDTCIVDPVTDLLTSCEVTA